PLCYCSQMNFKRIAVYCGSSNEVAEKYFDLARSLGEALAHRNIELVYGGGRVGLMGTVADSTLAAGGRVTGVIPRKLDDLELGHRGIQDLFIVESMHERKAMMMHLSDGFISLPGGFGTLEELSEVISLGTLNFHHKPVGILDDDGFYDDLIAFFDRARDAGFIRKRQGEFLQRSADPSTLIDAMSKAIPKDINEWL
ncbi:MAG: TIGR00730 family Rossman fold protein, partial [Bradymonadia bacterium]